MRAPGEAGNGVGSCGGGGCGCGGAAGAAANEREDAGVGAKSGGAGGAVVGAVSRRSFMKTLGVSAAAASLSAVAERARAGGLAGDVDEMPTLGPDPVEITLTVNGAPAKLTIDPSATLLETLRVQMNLTGPKEICDRGSCGGCSVLVDGKQINSCMMLALDAVGTQVTTVEGLAKDGKLDPVQEAFIKHDAMQCGYCTPGFVVACRAMLNETPKPTLEQIKHRLSGNICKCGTYTNIFNAALEASGQAPVMDLTLDGKGV